MEWDEEGWERGRRRVEAWCVSEIDCTAINDPLALDAISLEIVAHRITLMIQSDQCTMEVGSGFTYKWCA